MAALRIEELNAGTISAANRLTLKPGQEDFLEPETYTSVASSSTTTTWSAT
jgi:diamine N-acetyltransferase